MGSLGVRYCSRCQKTRSAPRTPGTRDVFPSSVSELVERVRGVTDKPLAVGFEITTTDHTSAVARIADGVIVGSTVVRRCTGVHRASRRSPRRCARRWRAVSLDRGDQLTNHGEAEEEVDRARPPQVPTGKLHGFAARLVSSSS